MSDIKGIERAIADIKAGRPVIVVARSLAEIPVEMPSRASTVTVYAVPCRSWLTRNIGGRSSRSASASVTATQM